MGDTHRFGIAQVFNIHRYKIPILIAGVGHQGTINPHFAKSRQAATPNGERNLLLAKAIGMFT